MSLIKREKHYYLNNYKIFEGAYGTVQNFFMRCQQGLVKLCKIYRGVFTEMAKGRKGRIRVDPGASVEKWGQEESSY